MYDKFLENYLPLSDATVRQTLLHAARTASIPKRTLLIESGEVQRQIPILVHGIIRGFLLDADGRDITDCFLFQRGEFAMACNDLGKPSQISLETMTDCELVLIPLATILPLMETSLELLRLYNRVLIEALDRHWEGKMLLYRCNAMQRYQWFLKRYPGLIDRVSNKHIASFLGMTPVTLSRLRRQVREGEPDEPQTEPPRQAPHEIKEENEGGIST